MGDPRMTGQPFDDERTIIRPLPRSSPPRREPPPPLVSFASAAEAGINPLMRSASTLLLLSTQLNSTVKAPDIPTLHRNLANEIREFERRAERAGVDAETVRRASYVLCTVVDEAVLNTPWGHASGWAQRSLLSSFHKEVSGGKRFFEMLRVLIRHPEKNLDLLELMYVSLALGFEGSYRIEPGGHERLARVRDDLYRLIDRHRGGGDRALSPHWRGVEASDTFTHQWPLWSVVAVVATLLGLVYAALLFWLNRVSDPVLEALYAMKLPALEIPQPASPKPPPAVSLTLSDLLAPEIEKGQVWVVETAREARVTLASGALFPSGRATVAPRAIPVLERIGEALEQVPGHIVITGHTDDRPIRSVRFPSNWHLSKARAQSVAAVIERFLSDPKRILVEGRGETEPVASNDTPEGRAKNRRVEILLIR